MEKLKPFWNDGSNNIIYPGRYSESCKSKISWEEKIVYKNWDKANNQFICKYPNTVFMNGNTENKEIALTFDDAPDESITDNILNILKLYNIKASFSLIGQHIEHNPEVALRIYNEGHIIMNHTFYHKDLSLLNKDDIVDELKLNNNIIKNIFGIEPSMIRPPYGKLSNQAIETIAELGYKIILWSYNTCDWTAQAPSDVLDGMISQIRNGEVILLHSYENKENTVKALPVIIKELVNNGFSFVTVDKLFRISPILPIGHGRLSI